MFIKTVSTTSGMNPIKFDETGGVFYWILNTGLSTIYASTKSAFTAGDDGVVSLGPKESRRLETNNDTIYILGEGQVEIHNQRDGICSFKQAPTSSGSGGGGTVDAYTKTESDAKYASKALYGDTTINVGRKAGSAVGEKSTAEGLDTTASGNASHAEGAGTIADDGYSHAEGYTTIASGFASHAEGSYTMASGFASHAEGSYTMTNNDAEHASGKFNVSNEDTLFSVGDGTDDNNRHNAFEITTTGGKLHDKDIATIDLIPTTLPANGGNADTVGGKSAGEFMPYIGYVTDLGAVNQNCICSWDPNTLNTPYKAGKTNAAAGICIVNSASGLWPTYFVICAGAKQCFIHYQKSNNGEFVGNWKEISTTPIKSTTVNGSTDTFGSLLLWSGSSGTPIAAVGDGNKIFIPFIGTGDNYYLTVHDLSGNAIANTTASATVFYI